MLETFASKEEVMIHHTVCASKLVAKTNHFCIQAMMVD